MNKKQKIAALKDMLMSPGRQLREEELDKLIKSNEEQILRPKNTIKDSWKNEKLYTYYDLMRMNLDNLESVKVYAKNFINWNKVTQLQQKVEDNIG